MEQIASKKFFQKTIVPLLLAAALLISWAAPLSAHADTPIFSGVVDAQAEEGQSFDLLSEVSAVDADGHSLEVIVKQVTCDEEPVPVSGSILTMGPVGTIYQVEYLAISGENDTETYTAQRTIESIASPVSEDTVPIPEGTMDGVETPQQSGANSPQPDTGSEPPIPGVSQPEISTLDEAIPGEVPDAEPSPDILSDELQTQNGLPIVFQNGLHYITDPEYPDDPIILYCMNNKLAWPHSTGEHPQVPNYTEGYLTPEHFASQAEYDDCIAKLRKILFAGFPYNGERLYKLVAEADLYKPTEQEFNNMLILPPQLAADFPYLAHHKYVLDDVSNPKHLEELRTFVNDVLALNWAGGTTEHGLSYDDIISMPFYKAANAMSFSGTNPSKDDVQTVFANLYSSSYFVTQEQAYDATNLAIWMLMCDYKIESNDISNQEYNPLANVLYQYCQHGDLLEHAPDPNQIYVEGDLNFSYNPKDGMWHSGKLKIVEPPEYNGLYHLDLPEGVTAICEDANHIYANEEYELVSATQPKDGDQFRFHATIDWLQDMKQYSPINSTEFQHMVGALIRKTDVSQTLDYQSKPVGSIQISKVVYGTPSEQKETFSFTMVLSDTTVDGLYGDLFFDKGISNFTLTGGETKVASNLPVGITYSILEAVPEDYHVSYTDANGTIPLNNCARVVIENTKLNSLSISKTVQGELGDKTKPFHFDITLETADGVPFDGTYPCVISSISGTEQPREETLIFDHGKATVSLTHDQKVQIPDIPYGSQYTITEQEANKDGYTTTYNQNSTAPSGVLEGSTELQVVNTKEMVPATGIYDSGIGGMIVGVGLAVVGITLPLFDSIIRRKRGRHHG